MARKTSSGKPTGKRTATPSASALSRIVHEARQKYVVKPDATGKLTAKQTATGSGRIQFHVPVPVAHRSKAA
jgi:hypothetical protein